MKPKHDSKKDKTRSPMSVSQPGSQGLPPSCLQEHQTRDPHHFAVAQLLSRVQKPTTPMKPLFLKEVLQTCGIMYICMLKYAKCIIVSKKRTKNMYLYVHVTNCGYAAIHLSRSKKNRLPCLYMPVSSWMIIL